jgi:S1-C subfamily serine protease
MQSCHAPHSRGAVLQPWQVERQEQFTGSGFIIKGHVCLRVTSPRLTRVQLIITNAHVVNNYTTVRVRKNGGSDKFPAEVLVCLCASVCVC